MPRRKTDPLLAEVLAAQRHAEHNAKKVVTDGLGVTAKAALDMVRSLDGGLEGERLSNERIGRRWEVTAARVQEIGVAIEKYAAPMKVMKALVGKRALLVALAAQDRLLAKVEDEVEMKAMSADKLGRLMRDMVDSAALLTEGHQPSVNINVANITNSAETLERMRETMRSVKARLVAATDDAPEAAG